MSESLETELEQQLQPVNPFINSDGWLIYLSQKVNEPIAVQWNGEGEPPYAIRVQQITGDVRSAVTTRVVSLEQEGDAVICTIEWRSSSELLYSNRFLLPRGIRALSAFIENNLYDLFAVPHISHTEILEIKKKMGKDQFRQFYRLGFSEKEDGYVTNEQLAQLKTVVANMLGLSTESYAIALFPLEDKVLRGEILLPDDNPDGTAITTFFISFNTGVIQLGEEIDVHRNDVASKVSCLVALHGE
jgi:hypothetical protein